MRDSVNLRYTPRGVATRPAVSFTGFNRLVAALAILACVPWQAAVAQQAPPVETQPLPPPLNAPMSPPSAIAPSPAPPAAPTPSPPAATAPMIPGGGNSGPAITGTAPSQPPAPSVGIPPPPPLPPAVTTAPPPAAQQPAATAPEAVPDPTAPAMIMMEAKPVLALKGESSWDDGFDNLTKAFQRLDREARRLKLTVKGQPRAYFLWSDDNNFRYEAQLFLEQEPQPAPRLPSDLKIGLSPAGKALQFTHTGAYDDLEGTYDLIAAYLDEKKLITRNLFVEEYMKLPKTAEDVELEVNIFVLID